MRPKGAPQFAFVMTAEQKERLEDLASALDCSQAQVVKTAIDQLYASLPAVKKKALAEARAAVTRARRPA